MTNHEIIDGLLDNYPDAKNEIDKKMQEAYSQMQELRMFCLQKKLNIEIIETTEQFFLTNQIDPSKYTFPRYLEKYIFCLSNYWSAYEYYKGSQMSKGKFNLFDSLKKHDLKTNSIESIDEYDEILRKMEDYWMASNQVYTKFLISIIRKKYLR